MGRGQDTYFYRKNYKGRIFYILFLSLIVFILLLIKFILYYCRL